MIFISLWVNDDRSLQSHDYLTMCIVLANSFMRISIFMCEHEFLKKLCFLFMIRKRYHVQWRFSSYVCSFGICYICEVLIHPNMKAVKLNGF